MDWKHKGIGLGLIGLGVTIGVGLLPLSGFIVPSWVLYCGYTVAFFLVICGLSLVWGLRWRSPVYRDGLLPPQEKNGIEFFATMDELRAKHPLSETFKAGNEIHAYFLTGEGVFAEDINYVKCIKRLILPDPNKNNLARLKRLNSSIDYQAQIMTYANKVRQHQHDEDSVRFYEDFLGISLLFCNPSKSDGWVQLGIILPETESSERQHFRFSKTIYEDGFISLYKTFEEMWNESDGKTGDEHFEDGYEQD